MSCFADAVDARVDARFTGHEAAAAAPTGPGAACRGCEVGGACEEPVVVGASGPVLVVVATAEPEVVDVAGPGTARRPAAAGTEAWGDGAAEQAARKAAPSSSQGPLGCTVIDLHRTKRYWGVPLVLVAALAGCGSARPSGLPAAVTTTVPAAPTTTTTSTSVPAPTTTEVPPFSVTTTAVTAADLPYTWRPGCPVAPSQLTMLHMPFWGFDGRPHAGEMVVNASVAGAVETVFRTLYDQRFPIEEMVPEDAYRGNDNAAAAADDTSGFNCRLAVVPAGQPDSWSVHAYGEAIDVNDVQNPYIDGSLVIPPAGAAYVNRSDVRPGMAVPGGLLVDAFASVGWKWGGRWVSTPDYQHFSSTGG